MRGCRNILSFLLQELTIYESLFFFLLSLFTDEGSIAPTILTISPLLSKFECGLLPIMPILDTGCLRI